MSSLKELYSTWVIIHRRVEGNKPRNTVYQVVCFINDIKNPSCSELEYGGFLIFNQRCNTYRIYISVIHLLKYVRAGAEE